MWGDFFVWRGHILRFVPFSYLSFTSLTLSFSDATIKRNIKRFHKSCKSKHNQRPSAHHQDMFTRRYVARDGVQFNMYALLQSLWCSTSCWTFVTLLTILNIIKERDMEKKCFWIESRKEEHQWWHSNTRECSQLTPNSMDDIWWHSQPIFFFPTSRWCEIILRHFAAPRVREGGRGVPGPASVASSRAPDQ